MSHSWESRLGILRIEIAYIISENLDTENLCGAEGLGMFSYFEALEPMVFEISAGLSPREEQGAARHVLFHPMDCIPPQTGVF